MNAQSIFNGQYYAWKKDRRKGIFESNALKVKALSQSQKRRVGNERLSTFVKILIIDQEKTIEVPAREIIDYWDSYVDEREHYRRERELRDARVTKNRLTTEIRLQMLQAAFRAKQIHPTMTLENIGHYSVEFKMNKEDAFEWLGVTDDVVAAAVSARMEDLALPDPDRSDSIVPYDL